MIYEEIGPRCLWCDRPLDDFEDPYYGDRFALILDLCIDCCNLRYRKAEDPPIAHFVEIVYREIMHDIRRLR